MKTLNALLIASALIAAGSTGAFASSDDSAAGASVDRFIATGTAGTAVQARETVDLSNPSWSND